MGAPKPPALVPETVNSDIKDPYGYSVVHHALPNVFKAPGGSDSVII